MTRFAAVLVGLLLGPALAGSADRETLFGQDTSWPRTVVLTNDDGIEAEGLLALARAFAPTARVYVIAPLENRSGSTNYISAIAARGIEVERVDLGAGITGYGVDGYPADAVTWAIRGLLADDPPDLVISGVNTGPNLTDDWALSGTVGAARAAALFGVPAIAVSGWTSGQPETLELVARWLVELAGSDLVRNLETGGYLTISVPRVAASEIEGVAVAARSPRDWRIDMERSADDVAPGRERWSLRFTSLEISEPVGSDLYYYKNNLIAVVPMKVDEHDWELYETLLRARDPLPAWPATDLSR
jgi:5'-nucleotidase